MRGKARSARPRHAPSHTLRAAGLGVPALVLVVAMLHLEHKEMLPYNAEMVVEEAQSFRRETAATQHAYDRADLFRVRCVPA